MKLWKNLLCAVALAAAALPGAAHADGDDERATEPPATTRPARTAERPTPARRAATRKARTNRRARRARATAPRIKQYDFLGDELRGDLVSPDGFDERFRVDTKHTSLIRVRRDFVPEIGKAADDL